MPLATREQLAAQSARRFAECEAGGMRFRLRSLTAAERESFEAATLTDDDGLRAERLETAKRRLLALVLVDADGKPFYPNEAAAVAELAAVDGRLVDQLFNAARKHVGFDAGDMAKLVTAEKPD